MKPSHKLLVFLPLFVVGPEQVEATSIYKPVFCAAAIREAKKNVHESCTVELATYRVFDAPDGSRKAELVSIVPTDHLKAWAACVGENWSKTEQDLSQPLEVDDRVSVEFRLGECGN